MHLVLYYNDKLQSLPISLSLYIYCIPPSLSLFSFLLSFCCEICQHNLRGLQQADKLNTCSLILDIILCFTI